MKTCDFLIIGGGIIGINVARFLKKMYLDAKIIVIEKEHACGLHASGRNSGVLHAGFYYTPDSLKARFTRLGNQQLTEYCEQKKIPLNKCGKLVVAKDENDLVSLRELLKRGEKNGVVLHELTDAEARKIEPRVKTYQRALFSPTTSSVNPSALIFAMCEDAINEGIEIHCGVKYLKRKKNGVLLTSTGKYQAHHVTNAGGLYADKIARDFGFSKNFRILPFKGMYLYSEELPFSIRTHIYPVPDLKNPFLGVHFTVAADGKIKIGPTAIPAFWREQYHFFDNFKFNEFVDILFRQMKLFIGSKFDFKKLALEEMKKYSMPYLVQLAAVLAKEIKKEDFIHFGKAGIRAQLLNVKEKKLEMDFILEGDNKSMHILNAVSPGFTSGLPFAHYVCDQIKQLF
jgi:L-2-hydroxyglutarate oxidase LhgO